MGHIIEAAAFVSMALAVVGLACRSERLERRVAALEDDMPIPDKWYAPDIDKQEGEL